MSSGSVAGTGMNKDGCPGEGANCGVCRRSDKDCTNARMVQCDECDLWYHYDCVNVNDSIRDCEWSCNVCVRTSLEKQKRALREQMQHFERQQKQWQQEQQKHQEQTEEQQEKLEQWRNQQKLEQREQEQFSQLQIGQLQLQQQSFPLEATTSQPKTALKVDSGMSKQQQQAKIVNSVVFEGLRAGDDNRTDPLASSTANNVSSSSRSNKASSKSSKRSVKLRELQAKALEARRALEKKQLEERLALEQEMLEASDSEEESISSLAKINEWLEKTDNAGNEARISMDGTPLPVYNELLRKPVVGSQSRLPSVPDPVVPTIVQQPNGYSAPLHPHVSQRPGASLAPGVRYTEHVGPSRNFPEFHPNYQLPLCGYPAVASEFPSMPAYNAPPRQDPQKLPYYGRIPQNVSRPAMVTSTPRQGLTASQSLYQPQMHYDSVPLNSGHLAARQTVKDLPKFGGDPEDWPRFIAAYERTSRMCAFRNDELLDRLESSLHDKAFNAVKSLLLHPDNVPVIISRLKTLFGNPEFIVETMIRKIRLMPPPKADKLETIVDFGVAVQNLCATIQVCQMDERLYNVAILQELVDSLPSTLKMQWAFHRKQTGTATMLDFSNWFGEMVDALSQVIRPAVYIKSSKFDNKIERQARRTEAYVHIHSADSVDQVDHKCCLACGNNCNNLDECVSFQEMTPNGRWALVNEKKICRKCLTKHLEACERKIPCNQNGCTYLHHWMLHDDSKHKKQQPDIPTPIASCNTHFSSQGRTLLKYIPVVLHGKGKSISTYAFLDAGSTATLMEHSLWEELSLSGEKSPLCISWTDGHIRCEENSVVFSVEISGTHTDQSFHLPEVHTVQSLDLPGQSMSLNSLEEHFKYLSDLPVESYTAVKPRIILGVNNSRLEFPLDSREGDENQPAAVLTRLGWVVYGPCQDPCTTSNKTMAQIGLRSRTTTTNQLYTTLPHPEYQNSAAKTEITPRYAHTQTENLPTPHNCHSEAEIRRSFSLSVPNSGTLSKTSKQSPSKSTRNIMDNSSCNKAVDSMHIKTHTVLDIGAIKYTRPRSLCTGGSVPQCANAPLLSTMSVANHQTSNSRW